MRGRHDGFISWIERDRRRASLRRLGRPTGIESADGHLDPESGPDVLVPPHDAGRTFVSLDSFVVATRLPRPLRAGRDKVRPPCNRGNRQHRSGPNHTGNHGSLLRDRTIQTNEKRRIPVRLLRQVLDSEARNAPELALVARHYRRSVFERDSGNTQVVSTDVELQFAVGSIRTCILLVLSGTWLPTRRRVPSPPATPASSRRDRCRRRGLRSGGPGRR